MHASAIIVVQPKGNFGMSTQVSRAIVFSNPGCDEFRCHSMHSSAPGSCSVQCNVRDRGLGEMIASCLE